ncbi:hypothetical protein F4808DRAFT_470860 [Astrocystis sublimbata]|nr:hypothetical protein F4808DRAFT_470860 [Astrocystis sublimbata]
MGLVYVARSVCLLPWAQLWRNPPTSLSSLPCRSFNMDTPHRSTDAAFSRTSSGSAFIPSAHMPSCFSGPSQPSTPYSSTHPAHVASISHQLLRLVDLNLTSTDIVYTPNALLNIGQTIMDDNHFQPSRNPHDRLVSDRVPWIPHAHAAQPPRQHQYTSPQIQALRPSVPLQPGPYRNIASPNWRAQMVEDAGPSHQQQSYNNPGQAADRPVNPLQHDAHIPEALLNSSIAYCYYRGDGQYTQLIPADDLLRYFPGIPLRQSHSDAMIVLPEPRGTLTSLFELFVLQDSATKAMFPHQSGLSTPSLSPYSMQLQIDSIVAATSQSPYRHPVYANAGPSPSNSAPIGLKRTKVYCDKWVHTGTCAFNQTGCKFKHEMPMDRETQQSLGLQGFPQWWKDQQARQTRQREVQTPTQPESPTNFNRSNGPRSINRRDVGRCRTTAPGLPDTLASGSGGPRGRASLTSDTGKQQIEWGHGGDYTSVVQSQGPASSMALTTTSRGVGGTASSGMATRRPGRQLSPRRVASISQFGPIGEPVRRGNLTGTPSNDSVRGSLDATPPRSVPQSSTQSPSAYLAHSLSGNPFAALDALEDGGDKNSSDEPVYTQASRPGGGHLS